MNNKKIMSSDIEYCINSNNKSTYKTEGEYICTYIINKLIDFIKINQQLKKNYIDIAKYTSKFALLNIENIVNISNVNYDKISDNLNSIKNNYILINVIFNYLNVFF